jgi:hypothetical protein
MEEFGVTAKIDDYIGSITTYFEHDNMQIQKTTLYFLCKLTDWNPAKREQGVEESNSTIEWQPLSSLIARMKKQGKRPVRITMDHSVVLERALDGQRN